MASTNVHLTTDLKGFLFTGGCGRTVACDCYFARGAFRDEGGGDCASYLEFRIRCPRRSFQVCGCPETPLLLDAREDTRYTPLKSCLRCAVVRYSQKQ
jgi:hypothetical protein